MIHAGGLAMTSGRGARGSGPAERRASIYVGALAAALALAVPVRAQTAGTDCGCSRTGDYVAPDPGVELVPADATTGLSPAGRYRVDVTSGPTQTPATLDVVRVSDGVTLLHNVSGIHWGFSPDADRFEIDSFTGVAPDQQFDYALYDLAGATPATPIWHDGPSPWSSTRIRFSHDGAVFLFAGTNATVGVSLALLDVANRSLYETSFFTSTSPGDVDDDSNPTVAGWGFGPDPTRFYYAHTVSTSQGLTEAMRVNVATNVDQETDTTADSFAAVFSPCGDTIAFIVKQLALSDQTEVDLFGTRDPHAATLGTVTLPHSALQVTVTAGAHEVEQAGVYNAFNPAAPNHADDTCPIANEPPTAAFEPPAGLVAGTPGTFTDESTDSDGHLVSWNWDFGDGGGSSAQNPSHTYASPGRYTVTLTVTDDGGAMSAVQEIVSVCGSLGGLSGRLLFRENYDLFVLDTDDGTRVRLTNQASSYSQILDGHFSPDGTQIAYADGGLFVAGIWVMNADGSSRRRLTDGSGSTHVYEFHDWPVWSPDGQWIAFSNSDVETPANQGLWMIRADGTGAVKIPGTSLRDNRPTFAPEIAGGCTALAAAQRNPGCYTVVFLHSLGTGTPIQSQIAEVAGDGSSNTALTPAAVYDGVDLSPDGTMLAYPRFLGLGVGITIYVRPRSGGSESQITPSGTDSYLFPVWSPDGGAIAYDHAIVDPGGSTIVENDIDVSDESGCTSRVLVSGPLVLRYPYDWSTGHAAQGLGSIDGEVRLDSSYLSTVAGAVVAISGDVQGTTTTDAQGHFHFDDIPIGANVTIRLISAPGAIPYPFDPFQTTVVADLVGHAIGVEVLATPAAAQISGTIRTASFQAVPGVTVTAVGPGGPIVATTDSNGAYSMTIHNWSDYTITPALAGYRFDPPSMSGQFSNASGVDFTATALPPPGLIAFVSSRTGDDDIWVADADGANAADLIGGDGNQRDPAWSPDGQSIAYASDEAGNGFELWVYDVEDDAATDLQTLGREPAWSPDGSELVFASDIGLQRLLLADGSVTSVTDDPSDASPAWSPDGGTIAFERDSGDGTSDIYEIATTPGANAFGFVTYAGDDRDPAFAAVGGGFAYATQEGNTGNTLSILAQWPTEGFLLGEGENPTWSRDGTQVAYDSAGSIYRIDPRAGSFTTISSSGSDRDPSWQPAPACSNGVDDDGDGLVDYPADPGCSSPMDTSEHDPALPCDDGIDNDGDGLIDYKADGSGDPGCPFPAFSTESPACDDGIDNDGDGKIDFDGGASATQGAVHGEPDPGCWLPYRPNEIDPDCGLGAELVVVLPLLRRLRRARRGGGSGEA